jgi:hypothetical protein
MVGFASAPSSPSQRRSTSVLHVLISLCEIYIGTEYSNAGPLGPQSLSFAWAGTHARG